MIHEWMMKLARSLVNKALAVAVQNAKVSAEERAERIDVMKRNQKIMTREEQ